LTRSRDLARDPSASDWPEEDLDLFSREHSGFEENGTNAREGIDCFPVSNHGHFAFTQRDALLRCTGQAISSTNVLSADEFGIDSLSAD